MRTLYCGLSLAVLALLAPVPRSAAADAEKPEPGFTPLFTGKDLSGWKTEKGDALEEKSEAFKGRFKVNDGILVIDPKVKGDVKIQTVKEYSGDVHIKFDYLPGPGCNNDL